jgi:hypothetical protein
MSTGTITPPFGSCNNFPPTSVSWRKAILLNRSVLLAVWPRHFPRHSFYDLHLISPIDRANSYWDGDDWKRAAQSYHTDRKRGL